MIRLAATYKARQVGNVTVLDIGGRINNGVRLVFGTGLQEVISDFAARGQKNIVLNLRDLAYTDSSGLADMAGAASSLRKQGGDLRIVDPSIAVKKALQVTRLDTLIEVKPDEASALEAFSKAQPGGTAAP